MNPKRTTWDSIGSDEEKLADLNADLEEEGTLGNRGSSL